MMDAYVTLEGPANHRITRTRSRFLAIVSPADSAEDLAGQLEAARRAHHDATHHCHAYRILDGPSILEGCDDDGEPAGSAGAPMLAQLSGRQLCNVLAIVIRRYGGSPLGVGGLIRAYSDAVSGALDGASVVRRERRIRVVLRFPSEVNGGVLSTLHRFPVTVEALVYEDPVHLELAAPPSQIGRLQTALVEATGARVEWEVVT